MLSVRNTAVPEPPADCQSDGRPAHPRAAGPGCWAYELPFEKSGIPENVLGSVEYARPTL
jgi:hypothetical protein